MTGYLRGADRDWYFNDNTQKWYPVVIDKEIVLYYLGLYETLEIVSEYFMASIDRTGLTFRNNFKGIIINDSTK